MFSNTSRSYGLRQMRTKKRNSFITVVILGCIIIVFFFAYQAFGSNYPPEPTLKQLIILFRHGEKTATNSYPSDPYKDYKWPGGPGALTNKGKLEMYQLGSTLKKQYGHFIGDLYLPNEISILSSYLPRCQMSAMTLLAGLFPPVGIQVWNKNLLWQPIPVNPIPRANDSLITARAYCKTFEKEKERSDEDLHAHLTEKDNELFKYLSSNTGSFINHIEQVEFLYFTLKIQSDNGLKLPDWTKSVYPEPLRTFAAMNLACYTRTPLLKRLQGGPLLKQWIENMQHGNKKVYLYSGHDTTIVNIMRTLGFEDPDFLPDYGATLVFELHHAVEENFVKAVYYNSSQTITPAELRLPGCKSVHCPLEHLAENVKPNLPQDWVKECNVAIT